MFVQIIQDATYVLLYEFNERFISIFEVAFITFLGCQLQKCIIFQFVLGIYGLFILNISMNSESIEASVLWMAVVRQYFQFNVS